MSEKTTEELFLTADNFRNNGRIDDALKAYALVVEKANKDNDVLSAAKAMQMSAAAINSTLTPQTAGRYQDSIKYLTNAASLYQSISDQTGVGACYRDLGVAATKSNDGNAAEYFNKAIAILEKTDDLGGLAATYAKLGLYLTRTGNIDEGISNIDKALGIFSQATYADFFKATTLFNKAQLLAKQKKYQEAIDLAVEALSWFEADHGGSQYGERICEITGLIGLCYNALGNLPLAKQYLTRYQAGLKKLDAPVVVVLEDELGKIFAE